MAKVKEEELTTHEKLQCFTVMEVADILKVGKNAVYNLINEKKLKAFNVGSQATRITTKSLIEFIEQNYEKGGK